MDFEKQLDDLRDHVSEVQASVQTAASETHDQVKQRIDRARTEMDKATDEARRNLANAAASDASKWAQLKADASTRMASVKAKVDQRSNEFDARVAATNADAAKADAYAAIDFADWAVENARLVILDAIDARVYADERAATAAV
jgi:hypothetical protein